MQTAVYLLTKASLLGSYELTKAALMDSVDIIGIGTSLAKIDMTGFAIAQLRAEVAELGRKLDVMLGAPLEIALHSLNDALIKMENEDLAGTIQELKEVKRNAKQAFAYAKGQDQRKGRLKNGVFALQMKIYAEVLIQGYDKEKNKIVPFFLMTDQKKRMIGQLVEADVQQAKSFHLSQKDSWFSTNKEQKAQERQDILDKLLRTCYPLISEGRGLTSSFAPMKFPFHLKVLPEFLPEGREDSAVVTIGQVEGRPLTVQIWRGSGMAWCAMASEPYLRIVPNSTEVHFRLTGLFPEATVTL